MNRRETLAMALAFFLTAITAMAAPVFERVAGLERGPTFPDRGTLLRFNNSFYGTTPGGGAFGVGLLYRVADSGIVTPLVHFSGTGKDAQGRLPVAGLTTSSTSLIWGVTQRGGVTDQGTIFRFDPASEVFTTIANFTGANGGAPGANPGAALVPDGAGFLWGTTEFGGAGNAGTIFKVSESSGAVTSVASFEGANGANPIARLVDDGAGFFWGTTRFGGSANLGVIFKVSKSTGAVSLAAQFTGIAGAVRGSSPSSGLTLDTNQNLWGVTQQGGVNNQGTIFKIALATNAFTTVGDFTGEAGSTPGAQPAGELLLDSAGFFWGTASAGGATNNGVVFKISATSNAYTPIAQFTRDSGTMRGASPLAGFVMNGPNSFWSTTQLGGTANLGTIFRINTATGEFTTVKDLEAGLPGMNGIIPYSNLVNDGTGLLWGTTSTGGARDQGTVFRLNPATGAVVTAVDFTGLTGSAKGSQPLSSLTRDGAGSLWGTTRTGGANNVGTVFKVNSSTNAFTTIVEFTGAAGAVKGQQPIGGLYFDGAGSFWGTTSQGGAANQGTLFKIDAATGNLTTILEFTGMAGAVPGALPYAELVSDGAGFLWGTTLRGGDANRGTIFKLNAATGAYSLVAAFSGTPGPTVGSQPAAALLRMGDFFWGTTAEGGSGNNGTVYKVNIATGAVSTVVEFTGVTGNFLGTLPLAGLTLDGSGNLWGTTTQGGRTGLGTVYMIAPGDVFSNVFSFEGSNGSIHGTGPGYGHLYLHTDGALYGTTLSSGRTAAGAPAGGGQIYRIRQSGPSPIESWKLTHLGDANAPDQGDPDRDGIATLTEYALLLRPDVPDAAGGIHPQAFAYPEGKRLRLIVPRDPAHNDVTVEVQAAGSLSGPWSTLATSVLGAPFSGPGYVSGDANTPGIKSVEIRDTVNLVSAPQRFLRVRVTH